MQANDVVLRNVEWMEVSNKNTLSSECRLRNRNPGTTRNSDRNVEIWTAENSLNAKWGFVEFANIEVTETIEMARVQLSETQYPGFKLHLKHSQLAHHNLHQMHQMPEFKYRLSQSLMEILKQ
ncbi:unnamed protein product [Caenorhabditis angaria]|uniref:Uncharacterized protein n=1 Tax=Caenorhabditis angaria TaxID=860376 RepID=A0A9P1MTU4_9PELO|nr:unnamed protein product [Caenorhabditis angaria]